MDIFYFYPDFIWKHFGQSLTAENEEISYWILKMCFHQLIDGEFICLFTNIQSNTSQTKMKHQQDIWKSNRGKVSLTLCEFKKWFDNSSSCFISTVNFKRERGEGISIFKYLVIFVRYPSYSILKVNTNNDMWWVISTIAAQTPKNVSEIQPPRGVVLHVYGCYLPMRMHLLLYFGSKIYLWKYLGRNMAWTAAA